MDRRKVIPAIPRALTIAGSDSGGGAGIQQDIRVFSALGVYASSVITALTAQNSLGVQAVSPVEPEFVKKQLAAVMEDIAPGYVKTGMLLTAGVVERVSRVLSGYPETVLVIDTVMLSKNGTVLLEPDGVTAMRDLLFPAATLITPNIPEAELLTDSAIRSVDDMKLAARRLCEIAGGRAAVLLKGGHLPGSEAVDCLFHRGRFRLFQADRVDTPHTHGTGCTLSSAITALLALGYSLEDACEKGIMLTRLAIKKAFPLGRGIGPLNVFSWKRADWKADS